MEHVSTFEACLFSFLFVLLSFWLYIFYRNTLVFEVRMRILKDDSVDFEERHRRYDSLPSYEAMLYQVFTFNWDDHWKQDGE